MPRPRARDRRPRPPVSWPVFWDVFLAVCAFVASLLVVLWLTTHAP